jgi:prepilin-type N-terminal cleavage/methylation domain-containing protein
MKCNNGYRWRSRAQGFTLIEIMLVAIIIAAILAVIIPRAFRANVDAKYSMVRQAASELGKWGITWAERNLKTQDVADTCNLNAYVAELVGYTGDDATYWPSNSTLPTMACRDPEPSTTVAGIMPQNQVLQNPFTGLSYLNSDNDGASVRAGLLYVAVADETVGSETYKNYYFVYTGSDATSAAAWYAGMGNGAPSLQEMKNGVFIARLVE